MHVNDMFDRKSIKAVINREREKDTQREFSRKLHA